MSHAATRAARLEDLPGLALSVSVGWLNGPWPGADVATLLQVCDRAMLLAKSEGRDRAIGVVHSQPPPQIIPEDLHSIPGSALLRTR